MRLRDEGTDAARRECRAGSKVEEEHLAGSSATHDLTSLIPYNYIREIH
jgi:hypothetical protein